MRPFIFTSVGMMSHLMKYLLQQNVSVYVYTQTDTAPILHNKRSGSTPHPPLLIFMSLWQVWLVCVCILKNLQCFKGQTKTKMNWMAVPDGEDKPF